MKKIYQTPNTKVVTIVPSKLMQTSEYIRINTTQDYDGVMTIESRRGSWGWDDEDEY